MIFYLLDSYFKFLYYLYSVNYFNVVCLLTLLSYFYSYIYFIKMMYFYVSFIKFIFQNELIDL